MLRWHASLAIATLCLVLGAGSGVSEAGTVTDTHVQITATLSGPDTFSPDEPVVVEVSGNLRSGGPLSWMLWLDTTWSYDANHFAKPEGGVPVAASPPYVWNAFSASAVVGPLSPGEHTLTLFVQREFSSSKYNVAVDLPITVGNATVPVGVDVLPGACPNPFSRKAKGVLPVALLGADDLDVGSIDPSSIRLAGVAPERWCYEDVSGADPADDGPCGCPLGAADGYEDLVLKFDRPSIAATLGDAERGESVALTLVAETVDGVPLEGIDCILLR